MLNVFEFAEYKPFLRAALPVTGAGRGGRSRLAEFLNCKLGFVSQVLSGPADFSLEHSLLISEFLHLSPDEQEYFLLLVEKDRAGSAKLRTFHQKRIDAILSARKEVQSRIHKSKDLSLADKNIYYSKWTYTAVHMCIRISNLRTAESIADYLGITIEESIDVLYNLEKFRLVRRQGNYFVPIEKRLHLGERSLALRSHHLNWRMESMRSLDRKSRDDLHYSSVMSISHSAAMKIRAFLLQTIEESEPIIAEAKDEGVYAVTLDLFEVGATKK